MPRRVLHCVPGPPPCSQKSTFLRASTAVRPPGRAELSIYQHHMTHNGAISRPAAQHSQSCQCCIQKGGMWTEYPRCELLLFFFCYNGEMWTAIMVHFYQWMCAFGVSPCSGWRDTIGRQCGNKSRPLLRGHMSEVKAAPIGTKTRSRPESVETRWRLYILKICSNILKKITIIGFKCIFFLWNKTSILLFRFLDGPWSIIPNSPSPKPTQDHVVKWSWGQDQSQVLQHYKLESKWSLMRLFDFKDKDEDISVSITRPISPPMKDS